MTHHCQECGAICYCDGDDTWYADDSPQADNCEHCLEEVVADLDEEEDTGIDFLDDPDDDDEFDDEDAE